MTIWKKKEISKDFRAFLSKVEFEEATGPTNKLKIIWI